MEKIFQDNKKKLGILCHITSLPSKYGMGCFGEECYDFIDFLAANGMTIWQILPINFTSIYNCPYDSISSFSIDEMFVDVDDLIQKELINKDDASILLNLKKTAKVNYKVVKSEKKRLLEKSFFNLKEENFKELDKFVKTHKFILDNAYFKALTIKFKTQNWREFPEKLQDQNSSEAQKFIKNNHDEIYKYIFNQFLVYKQWAKIKNYANKKGVKIFGDLPIYPNRNSFDVFHDYEMYKLDENKMPYVTGGVPADEFCKDGQDWGTCIYNWQKLKENGFEYMLNKIDISLQNFDIVRLDHFLGYFHHYENNVNNKNKSKWVDEGGEDFFNALFNRFDSSKFVVENLGADSSAGNKYIKKFNLKGMAVLQIALAKKSNRRYLPNNVDVNDFYYTGTHDNNTFIGYLGEISEKERIQFCKSIGADKELTNEQLLVYSYQRMINSKASTIIIPIQDFLLQNEKYRMNMAGVAAGCWEYSAPSNYKEIITNNLKEKFFNQSFLTIKK